MMQVVKQPIQRSKLRVFLGKTMYTYQRYWEWYKNRSQYTTTKSSSALTYTITTHQTPLYRKLKDVDMELQHNKVKNLSIAIPCLNGLVLSPGDTMSYWRHIGKTTKVKGYVDGMILHYGKYKTGTGGGLCQLSNLIYWLTLHTPLTVVERHRHSYDVFPDASRTQPFGSGATCAYNYIDLQIKNNTAQTYRLQLDITDSHLVGQWQCNQPSLYSYEVYEKDHKITMEPWGGYVRHNQIYRKVYTVQGDCIDDEFVTENHAMMMYEPMLQHAEEVT
ncbi:VanW family protein [Longirhabdus pacifica]|uniref:VanW family protein n=1 Tax=Longirhabdus pacifica TaxID=2305227 RepID=UPI0010087266|nr:VanW family protein [Longirhabdus pacifica]